MNTQPAPAPAHARIRIGIGSWTDSEYKGLLYPKGLPDSERLKTYATWFELVEVNSSYHAMPRREVVENWAAQTPPDFVFDVKLYKDFSENPGGAARGGLGPRFLDRLQPLIEARKLAALQLLLPPSFGPKGGRLEEYDPVIEKFAPHLLAIELRHKGWIEDERREHTMEFFRTRKLVCTGVDMPQIKGSKFLPPIDEVTNPRLAYLRLHGRRRDWTKLKTQEERHTYEYPANELDEIAARVRFLATKAEEVHVVANNHAQDFAPKTALALQRLLGLVRRTADTAG